MINITNTPPSQNENSIKESTSPVNKTINQDNPVGVPQFSKPPEKKSSPKKTILAILGLLSFFILGVSGVLISQKQYTDDSITAPNAPKSEPAAYINQESCHLSFSVNPVYEPTPTPTIIPSECGYTPCSTELPCSDDLTCVAADDGESYCSLPEYEDACIADPSVETCCNEPVIITECGFAPCSDDIACEEGLICITADDGDNYCSQIEYEDACIADPGIEACCTEPTITPTPTIIPECNSECTEDTTCTEIDKDWTCYFEDEVVETGNCRLTSNPISEECVEPKPSECGYTPCENNEDCDGDLTCVTADDGENYCSEPDYEDACIADPSVTTCCTEPTPTTPPEDPTPTTSVDATPTTTTTISSSSSTSSVTVKTTTKGAQPEYPEQLPQSGPEDWIQYLQVGLGALGVGALLLLFL